VCRRALRAFNDANGIHRPSNRPGCTFPYLSRDSRPVGSQPPFGVGQSSNPYPVDYRPAFAFSDLRYPLVHRRTLTGRFPRSLWGRLGLPRFARVPFPKELGPALPPAVHHLRGGKRRAPDLTAHLLVHACQPLWHVSYLDGSTAVHICWPYPSTPAPDCPEAGSRNPPHGSVARLSGGGYSVLSASHPGVTPNARLGRVPVAEHRIFDFPDKYACDLVSHVPSRSTCNVLRDRRNY